jgi:endonuclease YncB( thermonuclease family)
MKYLIPAILTLAILFSGQALSTHEEVELVEVVDGDTINVESDTIRFIGIDTPEISSENNPIEYDLENSTETRECLERYGEEASQYVKNSTSEKVGLVDDIKSDDRGTYDRRLSYIQTEGDLNRKLLVKGLAQVYLSDFSRKNEFYFWEYVAKKNDRGLWSCS